MADYVPLTDRIDHLERELARQPNALSRRMTLRRAFEEAGAQERRLGYQEGMRDVLDARQAEQEQAQREADGG
jgi:hypothetical protein